MCCLKPLNSNRSWHFSLKGLSLLPAAAPKLEGRESAAPLSLIFLSAAGRFAFGLSLRCSGLNTPAAAAQWKSPHYSCMTRLSDTQGGNGFWKLGDERWCWPKRRHGGKKGKRIETCDPTQKLPFYRNTLTDFSSVCLHPVSLLALINSFR